MSKISVIRLVNIRYNDDRMVIPDQVFFCGGKSTLIHLRNGGGKSVMTQLMCAPFLPKRYRDRDTRLFSSYFRQSAPSFILLEWELEGGAGRLLTGMMVHHTARNEEEGGEPIEMVNFIAQYDAHCAYDILSLPIFEEQDGGKRLKKFADCRAAFESFRKERGASFFLYDMAVNAQSRQYFDKLLEYGINTKEWSSIIRQVNRQEGGLSHFFDDCRSEKDLIIRKFLPAIESRLDTEGTGQIAQFRENIGKFTESYFNNLEKVKRRESFLHFQETGSDLEEKSGQVLNMEAESGQRAGELARLALDSETEADAVSGRLEKAREKLEDVQNRRYQIDHQELSQKAYHTMDERDRLLEEQASTTRWPLRIIRISSGILPSCSTA